MALSKQNFLDTFDIFSRLLFFNIPDAFNSLKFTQVICFALWSGFPFHKKGLIVVGTSSSRSESERKSTFRMKLAGKTYIRAGERPW